MYKEGDIYIQNIDCNCRQNYMKHKISLNIFGSFISLYHFSYTTKYATKNFIKQFIIEQVKQIY